MNLHPNDDRAAQAHAERAANVQLIRDAFGQPRVISSATDGALRLRSPDPHEPVGSALLAALARR
jgi:hypothetical protein